jgi:uncharacterized delta-60 repeat protein
MNNKELLGHVRMGGLSIAIWTAVALLSDSANVHGAVVEAWVQRHSSGLGNAEDLATELVTDGAGHVIIAGDSNDGLTGDDLVIFKYSGADGSLLWQQRYNGPGNGDDQAAGLALDSIGNVVVAGASFGLGTGLDYYTAKRAAADGALLWERRYNGTGNYNDWPSAVAVDRGDNVVVTGRSAAGASYDYYTAKYAAADGTLLWEKGYNGPSNRDDEPADVAVDAAGNVIVIGSSEGNLHVIKYGAADGAVLWERRFNGPAGSGGRALAVDRNGDVVVTGVSPLGIGPDYYTARLAGADGAQIWAQRFDGPANAYDQPHALALDASGNAIVTGQSYSREGGFDYYTAKYAAADGALLWGRRFDGPDHGSDFAYGVSVDARGDVLMTGESWSNANKFDYYTLKYSGVDGTTVWERRYDGPGHGIDVPLAMGLDRDGNVAVTGGSPRIGGSYDFFTIEYASADGAPLWEQSYNGPFENYDAANAAAIDAAGNVIVTGTSAGADGNGDAYTIKYDENGAIVWTHRYDGPGYNGAGFGHDAGNAVAVDGNGNVAVTGSSVSLEGGLDFYTAKYAAADGALLWERRYDGPAGNDEASAVASDASGNVIVAGQSYGSPGGGEAEPNFYTAKYAAADGSLLWERRYDGADKADWVTGMKLDAEGNVVVTGPSGGPVGDIDFYTAKYSGANGMLLWGHRYDGPANYTDVANALAIDPAGNVIVTGASTSRQPEPHYDIYTAKYAAADGRLLWEVRHNGPANLDDEGLGVAVDAEGNALITGYSCGQDGRQAIYTAKYRSTDGALLWEQSHYGPAPGEHVGTSIAVDDAGNAVISGHSFNGANNDYYTAKYAAADGALLWERRYNGPQIGLDYAGTRGLAVGPNGTVVITGVSDRDYATVVYRDVTAPRARGMLADVLARLKALRATVNDRNAVRGLDRCIAHLTAALAPTLWRDETHLNPASGESVFHESQKMVEILCALRGARDRNLPSAVLDTLVERVVDANRLLASIAIRDAIEAGLPESKVDQARRFLAGGDATADGRPCTQGIEHYRSAWKSVNRATIQTGSGRK